MLITVLAWFIKLEMEWLECLSQKIGCTSINCVNCWPFIRLLIEYKLFNVLLFWHLMSYAYTVCVQCFVFRCKFTQKPHVILSVHTCTRPLYMRCEDSSLKKREGSLEIGQVRLYVLVFFHSCGCSTSFIELFLNMTEVVQVYTYQRWQPSIRLPSSWFLAMLRSATRRFQLLCSSARPGPYISHIHCAQLLVLSIFVGFDCYMFPRKGRWEGGREGGQVTAVTIWWHWLTLSPLSSTLSTYGCANSECGHWPHIRKSLLAGPSVPGHPWSLSLWGHSHPS